MRGLVTTLLVMLFLGPPAIAQDRAGPEFRVNTHTVGAQREPSIAGLANGGFVVTWQSLSEDGSGYGVYGQRFSLLGNKVGNAFRINTYTTGDQNRPVVAALPAGGFVVVWQSFGQDGSRFGIYGQRYGILGNPIGTEFQVNTHTNDEQFEPSIAATTNGGFVVTWTSSNQDGAGRGIYGQRFDASGTRIGTEFRISALSEQITSSVAGLTAGRFVVVSSAYPDIYARRFNAQGVAIGDQFKINASDAPTTEELSVGSLRNGTFVVVWSSLDEDGSSWGVFAQRYTAWGARLGPIFQVNSYTQDAQGWPRVAGLGDGGFVVTWMTDSEDGSATGVYAQRYNQRGQRIGGEFRVNSYTRIEQRSPAIAAIANGGFVVVWQSNRQDGSGFGIYAQRFKP